MRTINKLTSRQIESFQEAGRYSDGGNLYLVVTQARTRQWVFRYRWQGKEKELGLGSAAPGRVSLANARKAAQAARDAISDGNNPQTLKNETKQSSNLQRTFDEVVGEYLASMEKGWKNKKHSKQWRYSLIVLAAPLSSKPIHLIEVTDVLATLRPHWDRVPETARRLRGRIESVLSFATSHKYRSGENPARWKDNLKGLLPKHKNKSSGHHAALPYEEMPQFIARLRKRQTDNESLACYALELTILTVLRTSEVLNSKFQEFDLSKKIWIVPNDRMKMGREHRVPLSPRAVQIVEKLTERRWGDYLFPGMTINKPLSNMSMLMLLRRMGYVHITVHGFRSTFRDWASETTSFPGDVCEQVLAHLIENKTEAAYRRGDLLAKRSEVMTAWSSFIEPDRDTSIIPLVHVTRKA